MSIYLFFIWTLSFFCKFYFIRGLEPRASPRGAHPHAQIIIWTLSVRIERPFKHADLFLTQNHLFSNQFLCKCPCMLFVSFSMAFALGNFMGKRKGGYWCLNRKYGLWHKVRTLCHLPCLLDLVIHERATLPSLSFQHQGIKHVEQKRAVKSKLFGHCGTLGSLSPKQKRAVKIKLFVF